MLYGPKNIGIESSFNAICTRIRSYSVETIPYRTRVPPYIVVEFSTHMKKFGLILPEKKKIDRIETKKVTVASIFNDDDIEDDEEKELATLRKAKATETVTKSISSSNEFVEKVHQEALKEDPNIFNYDASIEEDLKKKNVHRNMRILGSNEESRYKITKEEPKYMKNILAKAEERKIESELIKLRNMKRKSGAIETAEDEEVFITAAYKNRLKELEEKEKELKARQIKEEDGDVTKRKDMSGFYYNLMKRNVSFGGGKPVNDEPIKKLKTEEPEKLETETEVAEILKTTAEEDSASVEDEPIVFGPRRPPVKK